MIERVENTSRVAKIIFAWAVPAILLGVVAVLLGSVTTLVESTCVACHKSESTSMQAGGHAAVSCSDCHRTVGLSGVIDLRLRVARMILATGTGSAASAAVFAPSDRCLQCHTAVLEHVVERSGLRMDHAAPAQAGMQCSECHARDIHGQIEGRSAQGVSMDACLRCHSATVATARCDVCHVDSVTRDSRLRTGSFSRTHGPDWIELHGMGDLATCSACHTVARCESCHGVTIPHPLDWFSRHGAESVVAAARCDDCHSGEFCTDCHVVSMPHSTEYRPVHAAEASDYGNEACYTCHAKEACDRCHEGHTHPGLAPERVRDLRHRAGLGD